MWFYVIEGTRFTLVRHPVEFGVLSSRKSYYCVIMRENNIAVFLWRGNSQTQLNYSKAHELILDSKFRKEYEKAEKRQSMLITSNNSLLEESEKSPVEKKQIRYTFGPVDITAKKSRDDDEKLKERLWVMSPIRRSQGDTHYINLFSTVKMDQEPQHFLQMF